MYIYCAIQQQQEQRPAAAEAASPPPATPATRLAALRANSRSGLKAWGICDLVDRLMHLEGMLSSRMLTYANVC
jgi:hypothetical protein